MSGTAGVEDSVSRKDKLCAQHCAHRLQIDFETNSTSLLTDPIKTRLSGDLGQLLSVLLPLDLHLPR